MTRGAKEHEQPMQTARILQIGTVNYGNFLRRQLMQLKRKGIKRILSFKVYRVFDAKRIMLVQQRTDTMCGGPKIMSS
jgi:hypothetical protein